MNTAPSPGLLSHHTVPSIAVTNCFTIASPSPVDCSPPVGRALRLDKRIGKSALMTPGLGYSGGTLARDVTQLRKFAREQRYKAKLFDAVADVNESTFDEIIVKLEKKLGKLDGKRVGVLGLTYKAGTSTVRRSPGSRPHSPSSASRPMARRSSPRG